MFDALHEFAMTCFHVVVMFCEYNTEICVCCLFPRKYATASAVSGSGKVTMRPWMFTPRKDMGLRGLLEPDAVSNLCCLILMNTFKTDATVAGTEYLAVTYCRTHWLESPLPTLSHADLGVSEDLQDPGKTFVVKGWSRIVCALGIIRFAFESEEFYEV